MNVHITKMEDLFYFENKEYQKAMKEQQEKQPSGTIDATGLKLAGDILGNKSVEAKKQALKVKLEVFDRDYSMDQEAEARNQHMDELRQSATQAGEQMRQLDDSLEELKASGFDEDSQEYQEMSAQREVWSQQISEAKEGIISDSKNQQAMRIARLKSNPMVAANKEGEAIVEAAGQSSIQEILDQGVDSFNERLEEEKKQEEEKDPLQEVSDSKDELEREMKEMLNKKKITEEDLLGLAVDESL